MHFFVIEAVNFLTLVRLSILVCSQPLDLLTGQIYNGSNAAAVAAVSLSLVMPATAAAAAAAESTVESTTWPAWLQQSMHKFPSYD